MLIKEYRIPLPMTVEEYKIAQLYMIAKKSREETKVSYIYIHKLVVKLHVIRTKENNDRYFERYFATRVIMDIILPPW